MTSFENTVSQENETQTGGSSSGARQLSSDIFTKHFKKGPLKSDKKVDAICNYCGAKYSFKPGGGYGTLQRHLNTKHPEKVGMLTGQTQLSGFATSSPNSPTLFRYDHASSSYGLAEAISVDSLSFSFGENVGINDWINRDVQPAFKKIPRTSLKRNLIKSYKKRKQNLIEYFSINNTHVSICSDIWSDHNLIHSYMGLTCHYIDENFELNKKVLAFRVFDDSHTANNICKIIHTILEEYRLVHRVFSISFDNASSNNASIPELTRVCQPNFGGRFFHTRCACHVLNLCVQDGLRVMQDLIKPIRDVIKYIWVHPNVTRTWLKYCENNNVHPKRFSKDVGHRWNSTYVLLCQSLEYQNLLCSFATEYIPSSNLLPQIWDLCAKVMEIFKNFNDATYTFSNVYKPTSNLFIVEALNIAFALNEGEKIYEIHEGIAHMKVKWLNYYKIIPDIFLVASVFDPRFKYDGLQEMLENYYDYLGLQNDYEIDVNNMIVRVKKHIHDLCSHYHVIDNVDSPLPPTTSSFSLRPGTKFLMDRSKKQRHSSSHSELDIYLTTIFEFDTDLDFNILAWWKRHKTTFPTLAKIAGQILAVPASTVAVEQTFSIGGNILDPRRSRLAPESLETQVCVNDWKRAELRTQSNIASSSSSDEYCGDPTTIPTTSESGGSS